MNELLALKMKVASLEQRLIEHQTALQKQARVNLHIAQSLRQIMEALPKNEAGEKLAFKDKIKLQ